jgi:hypothetical protein
MDCLSRKLLTARESRIRPGFNTIGDCSHDDPSQCRPAGGTNNKREQQELASSQNTVIGKPQSSGDGKCEDEESHELISIHPIG